MFKLVTLDNQTYLVIKEELELEDGLLPVDAPFEVYGLILKQRVDDKRCRCSLVTQLSEVENEQEHLFQLALDDSKAFFKDSI